MPGDTAGRSPQQRLRDGKRTPLEGDAVSEGDRVCWKNQAKK